MSCFEPGCVIDAKVGRRSVPSLLRRHLEVRPHNMGRGACGSENGIDAREGAGSRDGHNQR